MKSLEELLAIKEKAQAQIAARDADGQDGIRVVVGMATCGIAAGARPVLKAISDENGVKMPSFFGYMLWSLGILIPVFILDMLIFFI